MTERNSYTMADVARLASVSISTVSAVVNNKSNVSPELTKRVQDAIEAIGFRPHAGARGLRLGKTHIIGMVMQDIANPFFVEVMRGVEDVAGQNGYEIMVCDSNGQPDLEIKRLNALYAQRVDGILLAPSDSYTAREILLRKYAPIVYVDCVPIKADVPCVVTDNFDASYAATRYLIGLGHQRIAVISGRVVHSTIIDRVDGYRKAMQEANLPIRQEYMTHGQLPHRLRLSLRTDADELTGTADGDFHPEQSHDLGDTPGDQRIESSLPGACEHLELRRFGLGGRLQPGADGHPTTYVRDG